MAKVKIQGHASGTGILTVTAPNTSTDRTITLPDATGTLLNSDGSAASLTAIPAANITGTLPAISGANLTGISGGKVLQVVEGSATGTTTVSTTSDTYLTTLVTITPSATTSKVWVFLDIGFDTEDADGYGFTAKLSIDSGSSFVWTAGSNGYAHAADAGGQTSGYGTQSYTVIHSPSSTSALSYKVYVQNRNTTTIRYNGHSTTRIYAMEIGA